MPNESQSKLSQAFLEMSDEEWEQLNARGIAQHLVSLIPLSVAFQDDIEDAKKFFVEMKELSLPPRIDDQLEYLDKVRIGITTIVQDSNMEVFEIKSILDAALENLKKAYTKYAKLESETVGIIRTKSKRLPKEAFIEEVRSYWNHIDEFWPSEREAILGRWNKYFDETDPLLKNASEGMAVGATDTPQGVLIKVESLLKKRYSHLSAQKAADSLDRIKNYYVEELGLIPAYMGAKGNWKVEKDDCPDKRLPEVNSKLTDRFAFCKIDGKCCPSFNLSQGSYVKCKSFVRLKEADLIGDIRVIKSKSYLEKLHAISVTDPFVKMLFVESERRKGDLFYGKVIDERLETMLKQYPASNRVGTFSYRVYMVGNDPVLVSGKYAVAADKLLLETIGEGERMPKQASTVRIAGPLMRITFTSNALKDPEFRDFLRKKKAIRSKRLTYDVPFEREEEISFFLSELKDEFGYKIEVFSILEDADELMEKDFGVYRYSELPLFRYSSFRLALSYLPAVQSPQRELSRNATSMEGAEKLVDIANNLPEENPVRARVAVLADRLRVGAHILIAAKKDIIRYADGAIGLIPELGSRWVEKDQDTGEVSLVELLSVARPRQVAVGYTVRRLDTGKELALTHPWVRPLGKEACQACDSMAPPVDSPFGHIIGEDDVFYIVQIPKMPATIGPTGPVTPPPFGRFPGDNSLVIPPPSGINIPPFSVFPPMAAPPLAPPMMEQGPVVEQEGVFTVEEVPTNPDAPRDQNKTLDFAEEQIVDDVRQKTKPGLRFKSRPSAPIAPSGDSLEEVDAAVTKLRDMFKGDPRVKDVRKDLSPKGKPVLYVHSTMPKTMKSEVPTTMNGFSVIVSPLHASLSSEEETEGQDQAAQLAKELGRPAEGEDVVACDVLVSPIPSGPNGGKSGRDLPPGPYPNQVSGPVIEGDPIPTLKRPL